MERLGLLGERWGSILCRTFLEKATFRQKLLLFIIIRTLSPNAGHLPGISLVEQQQLVAH